MGLKDLSVKMITDGQPRDDSSNSFMDWPQFLHRSAYASSDADVSVRNYIYPEVEVHQVSFSIHAI